MNKKKIIATCRKILDLHNPSVTLYELLEETKVEGLTFYEAGIVSQALDAYMAGSKYYFQGYGEEPHEITPYSIVKELNEYNNVGTKDITYKQVTSIERWGYDCADDSNADYFDSCLSKIINGKSVELIGVLKQLPPSNITNITYKDICSGYGRIVYADLDYILTAQDNVIVLYQVEK